MGNQTRKFGIRSVIRRGAISAATTAGLLVSAQPILAVTKAASTPPKANDHILTSRFFLDELRALQGLKGRLTEDARFQKFLDLTWKHTMLEHPESAELMGSPYARRDSWTDYSLAALERRKLEARTSLETLKRFDEAKLTAKQKLNYELALYNAQRSVDSQRFPEELMPVNQLNGIQIELAQFMDQVSRKNVKDYQFMLARLEKVPQLYENTQALMREGLKRKVTPPKIVLRDVPTQIQSQIAKDPLKAPILLPFTQMPDSISEAERKALQAQASEVYEKKIAPAIQAFHDFFVKEYLPNCRETTAAGDLPDGKAWYDFAAASSTTTTLTADQIHDIGLREVSRIQNEMKKVIVAAGYKGTFIEYKESLQKKKENFYTTREDLLAGYRNIAKSVDPELPKLFNTLPRLPYGVQPIPTYSEKSAPGAYYIEGSLEAGRAGYFRANTDELKSRPKWEMEALTLHEAVPGHHLQIALAQEQTQLPEFRRFGTSYTAFVEGWGLYAESLGKELGLFKTPADQFGQLSYEIWRAVRLVVDTGMHAKGWSREKAIQYAEENSANSRRDIVVEIDRYLTWPAQALAYKIGQMKIRELREKAVAELGESFNVRLFHDQVLLDGPLPLALLEQKIQRWIRDQKTKQLAVESTNAKASGSL